MADRLAEPVPQMATPASQAEGATVATLVPRVHGEDEVPAIKASPQPSVPSQTSIVSQPVRSTGYYGARVTCMKYCCGSRQWRVYERRTEGDQLQESDPQRTYCIHAQKVSV